MTSIYDELKPVVAEVLGSEEFRQNGIKLVQLVPATGGTPDNPGAPTYVKTDLDAVARGAPTKFIMQGFAVAGDILVTAAVIEGLTPVPTRDFLEVDGKRYKITKDVSVPAAGTRVAWKFLARYGA